MVTCAGLSWPHRQLLHIKETVCITIISQPGEWSDAYHESSCEKHGEIWRETITYTSHQNVSSKTNQELHCVS